jgi:hypothetical protein
VTIPGPAPALGEERLKPNGRILNVLPLPKSWASSRGISLGDYAAVVYKGKVTYAVFGGEGPDDLIAEGSIQLLRAPRPTDFLSH